MGEIVEFGDENDSGSEELGDLLAEIAISDNESLDSVETVREIRESG